MSIYMFVVCVVLLYTMDVYTSISLCSCVYVCACVSVCLCEYAIDSVCVCVCVFACMQMMLWVCVLELCVRVYIYLYAVCGYGTQV